MIDGITDINGTVKSFFDPLKKGSKNIDDAMKNIPNLNNESRDYAESFSQNGSGSKDFRSELQSTMVKDRQGAVLEYKELDSRSKLNGAYVIKIYEVRFKGGEVKQMEFKFLRPTRGPEYQWVDAQFVPN